MVSHCFADRATLLSHTVREIFQSYLRNLLDFKIPTEPLPEADDEEEEDNRTEEERMQEARELLASLFSSNIKDEEEKKEIFDTEGEFTEKVDRVAEWMKECKHVIMFTGAGISTRSVGTNPKVVLGCVRLC